MKTLRLKHYKAISRAKLEDLNHTTSYKATVITSVWPWYKDKQVGGAEQRT